MNSTDSRLRLRSAENAAINEDWTAFEQLLPAFRVKPEPIHWYGQKEYPSWVQVTDDFPHVRYMLLREHQFESWNKFTQYMESLADENSSISQFESAVDAIVSGDLTGLQWLLLSNPSLVQARSMRIHRATLLHYLGANGVEAYRQKSPKNAPEVLKFLIKAGSGINAVAQMYGKDRTLGLVATSIYPLLAGVQHLLMEVLLDHGATTSCAPGEISDVNACLANGRLQAAEFLAGRGAKLDLEGAAGLGRLDMVKTFFSEDGNLKENTPIPQMQRGFWWACEYGRTTVVDFLLQRSLDVNNQQEGLSWAAFGGKLDAVRLFLERKTPLEIRNRWNSTVLGAAVWGARHTDNGTGHVPVIRMLIDAGADIDADPGLREQVDELLGLTGLVRRPAILSPVSLHLDVADIGRSLAFYRDVLGFQLRQMKRENQVPATTEIVFGPARIQLVEHESGAGKAGRRIIFFQTDDLSAMHAILQERGANTTGPQKVNWIKMNMFGLTDPDGHNIWFGQSYHEPYSEMHTPAGYGQLRKIMPELPLDDVPAGITYYRDTLGFRVNYEQHDLGVMDRDSVSLLLVARKEQFKGIGSCYVYVENVDALYAELRGKGACVQSEPLSQPWGLREFQVLDPEGNRITFAQTFE